MSIAGKSILIIDDDAAMLRALNRVLSGEGAVVVNASWAGEAMEHLASKWERFDLVITDLRMPILGGQTILGAVTTALPNVPVIIVTAFGTPELRAECLNRGAAAFLEKPLDTKQLLEAISLAFRPCKPTPLHRGSRRRGVKKLEASVVGSEIKPVVQPKGAGHGFSP